METLRFVMMLMMFETQPRVKRFYDVLQARARRAAPHPTRPHAVSGADAHSTAHGRD